MGKDRTEITGLALALLAGVFLGSAVAVARFAYEGGASGIVVASFRSILMTALMVGFILYRGGGFRLPRKLVPLAMFNGVLMSAMTYGNIGAVEFISVGLAALLFFTFPVIIAVIVTVLRIEPTSPLKLFSIVFAFVGLALMLGSSVGDSDWRGVVFSLVAAFATATNAVLVARFFREVNVFLMTFHFSWTALLVLILIGTFVADVRFPETPGGWGGVFGVAVLQASAMPMYLWSISHIGALKSGMATNIQPLTSIGEAWVLFDEVLGALQALGGFLVLGSILLMQWADMRLRRRSLTSAPVPDQMPPTNDILDGERNK